jgi:hypothetical protein
VFDWDYVDSRSPALAALRQPLFCAKPDLWLIAAQFCRPREDGNWDYFPRGFGQPGYLVDPAMRGRLEVEWMRLAGQRRWVIIPFVLAVLLFRTSFLRYPELSLALISAVFGFSWVLKALHRDRIAAILFESPERITELSSGERRQRNIELWHSTSRSGRLSEFLMHAGGIVFLGLAGLYGHSVPSLRMLSWVAPPLVAVLAFQFLRLVLLAWTAAQWSRSNPSESQTGA